MANEIRYVGRFVVSKTRILCTAVDVYTAWEPTDFAAHGHRTITSAANLGVEVAGGPRWYGAVQTRAITDELDALPACSDERWAAVHAYFAACEDEAYRLIEQAYPELAGHYPTPRRSQGNIDAIDVEEGRRLAEAEAERRARYASLAGVR